MTEREEFSKEIISSFIASIRAIQLMQAIENDDQDEFTNLVRKISSEIYEPLDIVNFKIAKILSRKTDKKHKTIVISANDML